MTITYYADVFGGSSLATLCPGNVCPDHTTATLGTGGGAPVLISVPKLDQNSAPPGFYYTLTQVAVALDWAATGNITVYNFYSAAVPFNNAYASTLMTLTAGGTQVVGNGVAATGPGSAACCNLVNGPGVFIGQTNFTSLTGSGANSQNAANLSFFQGAGSGSFNASIQTNPPSPGGTSTDPHASSLAYSGTGQMGAIMTISYTFTQTAAPEPATLTLMGGALLGLGVFVRRRRVAK